jgi:hypothetical protein
MAVGRAGGENSDNPLTASANYNSDGVYQSNTGLSVATFSTPLVEGKSDAEISNMKQNWKATLTVYVRNL